MSGKTSDSQIGLPAASSLDESVRGNFGHPESILNTALFDRVMERSNLQRALKQVRQNKGAPGIDGMTVDELPNYLKQHWLALRTELIAGQYRPQPVLRVELPKPDGGVRLLGIPTVLDRFIQQAIAQVISEQWEPHFHPQSYGFRPQRSAHQAVRQLQADVREGNEWVVDLDLAAFFDRVNHDRLMSRLNQHVGDRELLRLINRYLKAGVQVGERKEKTTMGVPQGGPLSPVLANVVLDELDWELDQRGRRFVDIIAELKEYLLGWRAYFGITEVVSPLRDIDKWIRRKLRCYLWKQWGRSGYRELRKRGISVKDAWYVSKSAHGPWRLSHTPALTRALPVKYFAQMGLPALAGSKN